MLRTLYLIFILLAGHLCLGQDISEQIIKSFIRGVELRQEGELEESIKVLSSTLDVANKNQQSYWAARTSYQLGVSKFLNRDSSGINTMKEAIMLFDAMGAKRKYEATTIYLNIGDLFQERGDLISALDFYNQGLAYGSKNFDNLEDTVAIVNLNNRKSDIYRIQGDYERAKRVIWNAPYYPSYGGSAYYNNLANAHRDEGIYLDSAEYYYLKDLEFDKSKEKSKSIALGYSNLGRLYLRSDDLIKSKAYLDSALSLFRAENHKDTVMVMNNMVQYHLKTGEMSEAGNIINILNEAINTLTGEEERLQYYELKRDYSALTGLNKDYRIFSNLYDSLADEIFRRQRLQVLEIENARERAVVEQENAQQERRIYQQNVLQIALGAGLMIFAGLFYYFMVTSRKMRALSEKNELLVREQNHRVKNNLQMINSLLNLQALKLRDEQSKDVLKKSQTRIQAISLLNRSLYEQKDISVVDLKNYVEELSIDVINSMTDQEVMANINIEDIQIDIDKATSLGLIINELIVNTIKHGGEENAGFDLTILKNAEKIQIHYKDHSKGFDKDQYQSSKSFGKRLIEIQAKQLKGELQILDKEQFQFQLTF